MVKVTIDWDRRFRLMRLHFAAEIILVPEIEKIGAHISPEKARIDFAFESKHLHTVYPSGRRSKEVDRGGS